MWASCSTIPSFKFPSCIKWAKNQAISQSKISSGLYTRHYSDVSVSSPHQSKARLKSYLLAGTSPLYLSSHKKLLFSVGALWAQGRQFLRGQVKGNCWSVKITAWNWIWTWFYLFWLSPSSCSWLIVSPFSTKLPTPAFVMWKGSYLCKDWWNHIHFPAVLRQTLSSALLVKDNSFTHHVMSQNTSCVTVQQ